VAVVEVVVRRPFVIGTRLFEHFIEDAPPGGPRGFLRSAAARSYAGLSSLPCWFFFFLLFLFEPRLELAGSSTLCFPLP
jgi:hypothetical protein